MIVLIPFTSLFVHLFIFSSFMISVRVSYHVTSSDGMTAHHDN